MSLWLTDEFRWELSPAMYCTNRMGGASARLSLSPCKGNTDYLAFAGVNWTFQSSKTFPYLVISYLHPGDFSSREWPFSILRRILILAHPGSSVSKCSSWGNIKPTNVLKNSADCESSYFRESHLGAVWSTWSGCAQNKCCLPSKHTTRAGD